MITGRELPRSRLIVYFGTLVGAAGLAALLRMTGLSKCGFAPTTAAVALAKAELGPVEVLARGVICEILVFLAVRLTTAARDIAGEILAILPPISAFVLLGMEHPVAHMFFFPIAALPGAPAGHDDTLWNLLLGTLGNVAGGAGGVRLAYGAPGERPSSDRRIGFAAGDRAG